MYDLKANFAPVPKPVNGFIGKADFTVAGSIRINNVSVFQTEDKSYRISYSEYGNTGKTYFVPRTPEVHAAIVNVIKLAVEAEDHFGHVTGDRCLRTTDSHNNKKNMEITGHLVNEPYADGRYSIDILDFGNLHGIITREAVNKTTNEPFIAVNMPSVIGPDGKVKMYEGKNGKPRAAKEFEGVLYSYENNEGKKQTINYEHILASRVRELRDGLMREKTEEKASLDSQVAAAENVKQQQGEFKCTFNDKSYDDELPF